MLAEDFFFGVTKKGLGKGVKEGDASPAVHLHDDAVGALHQLAVARFTGLARFFSQLTLDDLPPQGDRALRHLLFKLPVAAFDVEQAQAHPCESGPQDQNTGCNPEPEGLPEGRGDVHLDRYALVVPDTVAVRRPHLENVIATSQVGIAGVVAGAGLYPILIYADQAVGKAVFLRR